MTHDPTRVRVPEDVEALGTDAELRLMASIMVVFPGETPEKTQVTGLVADVFRHEETKAGGDGVKAPNEVRFPATDRPPIVVWAEADTAIARMSRIRISLLVQNAE